MADADQLSGSPAGCGSGEDRPVAHLTIPAGTEASNHLGLEERGAHTVRTPSAAPCCVSGRVADRRPAPRRDPAATLLDEARIVCTGCGNGKDPAMEALAPATPDSLPPIGDLIADEPLGH